MLLVSHPTFGKMLMAEEKLAPNQWTNIHTGVRWGMFITLRHHTYVPLPMSEVTILI